MILSVVKQSGVTLRGAGNLYSGNCPFHTDKNTPSFKVYPQTDSWYCFGKCSRGGDAVDYLMSYYNEDFLSAKERLDGLGGIDFKIKIPPKKEKVKIVPHEFIGYWHSMLADEHRGWFMNRGFTNQTINTQQFGWDGSRLCIPVWDWEPGNSHCLGVRKRIFGNEQNGSKYVGLKNMNGTCVWGKYHARSETVFAFAGELDACLAHQDGLPSFSLVNGVNSYNRFPDDWQNKWFPNTKNMVVIFDRAEEAIAGKFAQVWNSIKGFMSARLFQWPPQFNIKDYCEFRINNSIQAFNDILVTQGFSCDYNRV